MAQTGPNRATMAREYNGRGGTAGTSRVKAAHDELVSAGIVAHADREDPLPPVGELRDQMFRMLRAAALTPGSATNDQIQAARVVLQQTDGQSDPTAELAKRLGGDKAGLLAWLDATATQVRAELAAEEAKRLVAAGREARPNGESSPAADLPPAED